jgi:N-sulfoglucosamine sulfohydrolase
LIARWPGRVPAGSASSALVSLVDLLPTVLHAAQGLDDPHFDGRSFLPVLAGTSQRHQDYVFSTNTGDGSMNQSPARSICDGRFKLILNLTPAVPFKTHIDAGEAVDGLTYWRSWERLAHTDAAARQRLDHYRFRPSEELYDLRTDPYELQNRVDDPALRDELQRLRDRLRRWRLEQGEDITTVATSADARTGPLPYAS